MSYNDPLQVHFSQVTDSPNTSISEHEILSSASEEHSNTSPHAANQPETKRQSHRRACEACRKLKVQCTFDTPKTASCRRCVGAQRKCVIAARRVRHVGLYSTIGDLEKKVEELTRSLEDMTSKLAPATHSSPIDTDVLSNGTVTEEAAACCYTHFVKHMLPHMPIISMPEDLSAHEMKRAKPVLFLAIINSASGLLPLHVQQVVNQALSRVLADKVLIEGEKSIELIQAMQISCTWYSPPGRYEALKFYQWIHNAAVMAIDIGLSRKRVIGSLKSATGLDEPAQSKRKLPDPTTAEARRAWVTCFFLASGTAQNLRRSNLIRWSSYLKECVQYLEKSPDALTSDKILCQWVRIQQFADDVGIRLSIEDPGACAGLTDTAIQYGMKGLESQLQRLTSAASHDQSVLLQLGGILAKLYLHEVALHAGSAEVSDMQPPFTEEALRSIRPTQAENLSAPQIESLSITVATVHAAFDIFLTLPTETLRELPTFHFFRIVYAAIVLLKLAMDTTVPTSEIGRMFSLGDLKTAEYFSRLATNLNRAAEENRSASASKFGVVIRMIQFLYQKNVLKDGSPTVITSSNGRDKSWMHGDSGYDMPGQNFRNTQVAETTEPGQSLHQAPPSFEGRNISNHNGYSQHAPTCIPDTQHQLHSGERAGPKLLAEMESTWPAGLDFQNIDMGFGLFDIDSLAGYLDVGGGVAVLPDQEWVENT